MSLIRMHFSWTLPMSSYAEVKHPVSCWLPLTHKSQHTGRPLTCCPLHCSRVRLSHLAGSIVQSSRQTERGNQSGIIGDATLSKATNERPNSHDRPPIPASAEERTPSHHPLLSQLVNVSPPPALCLLMLPAVPLIPARPSVRPSASVGRDRRFRCTLTEFGSRAVRAFGARRTFHFNCILCRLSVVVRVRLGKIST